MVTKTKEDLALMAHLFRRAGFGATHEQLETYATKGYEATVEELLHPESQPSLEEDLLLRLNMGWQSAGGRSLEMTYWFYRMINTKRPLEEKIALFWHSVLCTGNTKINQQRVMGLTVNLFRRYGLGRFRDVLAKTGSDPGMIYYLDNCMSHRGAVNENWGRELLELFSMGVGNYTEDDVKDASRAFTGWTNAPTFPPFPYGRGATWDFLYDPTDHDDRNKVFLGQKGKFNGEDIVDVICGQPATARFVCRHLYNFFVADEPPVAEWPHKPPREPQAIQTLVDAYFQNDYDIRSVLRVLFNSDFFEAARFQKIKSPTEVVVGTVRLAKAFSFPEPGLIDVAMQCGYMGQELLNPPTVEGWHTGAEWIDSGTLVERVNFLSGQLGDVTKQGVKEISHRLSVSGQSLAPEELVEGCLEQLGGIGLTDETRRDLVELARRGGRINTGAEEFINRVAGMMAVIVATKEYQFN